MHMINFIDGVAVRRNVLNPLKYQDIPHEMVSLGACRQMSCLISISFFYFLLS